MKIIIVIAVLCLTLISANPLDIVYSRYSRRRAIKNRNGHNNKHVEEIREVFKTKLPPPVFSRHENDIENFLKCDVMCQNKKNESNVVRTTTPLSINTTPTIISTTAKPILTTTKAIQMTKSTERIENRLVRPTIPSNPYENINPDYTHIMNPVTIGTATRNPSTTTKYLFPIDNGQNNPIEYGDYNIVIDDLIATKKAPTTIPIDIDQATIRFEDIDDLIVTERAPTTIAIDIDQETVRFEDIDDLFVTERAPTTISINIDQETVRFEDIEGTTKMENITLTSEKINRWWTTTKSPKTTTPIIPTTTQWNFFKKIFREVIVPPITIARETTIPTTTTTASTTTATTSSIPITSTTTADDILLLSTTPIEYEYFEEHDDDYNPENDATQDYEEDNYEIK